MIFTIVIKLIYYDYETFPEKGSYFSFLSLYKISSIIAISRFLRMLNNDLTQFLVKNLL